MKRYWRFGKTKELYREMQCTEEMLMLCVGLLAKGTVQCRAAALFGEAVEKTAWGAMQQVSIRCSQMSSSVPLSPGKVLYL